MQRISDILKSHDNLSCQKERNHFNICDENNKPLITVRENGFIENTETLDIVGYAYKPDEKGLRTFIERGGELIGTYDINNGVFTINDKGKQVKKDIPVKATEIASKEDTLKAVNGSKFLMSLKDKSR